MYRKDLKQEFYTKKAKLEGYPARSVYKLEEIDKKFKIFKKGDFVLDLGSAPGSWLLYISKKIGEQGRVLGVDTESLKIKPGKNVLFLKKSIFDLDNSDIGRFGRKFDCIVADLSPKTSGIKIADVARSLELSEKSLDIAAKTLAIGGNFVCKIFESELSKEFLKEVSKYFKSVKIFKPKAVFKRSREFYVVAKEFKGKVKL